MFEFDMIEAEFAADMGEPAAVERRAPAFRPQLGLRLLTVAESEAERRLLRR